MAAVRTHGRRRHANHDVDNRCRDRRPAGSRGGYRGPWASGRLFLAQRRYHLRRYAWLPAARRHAAAVAGSRAPGALSQHLAAKTLATDPVDHERVVQSDEVHDVVAQDPARIEDVPGTDGERLDLEGARATGIAGDLGEQRAISATVERPQVGLTAAVLEDRDRHDGGRDQE